MGTNYYHHEMAPCDHCGAESPRRHIGKSSAGWVFALHVSPEDGIVDLPDWQRLWERSGVISDEYGETISPVDMWQRIAVRGSGTPKPKPYGYDSWDEFHRRNHSLIDAASGLLRSRINAHCIGPGAGTWDRMIGEFS